MSDNRRIRVFVSSTFRDMVEDRNELMTHAWPELRRFCEARQVELVEVDLRWGIAEEQSTRKETLKLCLDEIRACRPFFIGLLGERYGWGHDYDTRDCSGFVSEIYRSFGVLLPRNTSAQAVSPALDRLPFTDKVGKAARDRAVTDLQVGDLVYIPGHVMMAIGHVDGRTWVIHDTAGGSWFGADGKRVQAHLNGVSVTPLEPMMASDTVRYIDRITNIQRLRAKTPE